MRKTKTAIVITLATLLLSACGNEDSYTPKPKGYMRINLPAREYILYDTSALPFSFEASTSSVIELKKNDRRLKWVDIRYPQFSGIVFLSYIPLQSLSDLAGEVDTSYRLLSKHFGFSSGVDEKTYNDDAKSVYATTYSLQGQNVASTYQFWATDSSKHFLRGSLYIDCVPNNDSLAPVLKYIQMDINHLIETLQWRQ